MNKSESIINLAKALLKFQANVPNIPRDASNPFHKSKYASLTNILNGIHEGLNAAGLVVMQNPSGEGDAIQLSTMVIHAETGEFMESEFSMIPVKKDPQGIGSCLTYMRRYALAAILKLNVDDDDDGNGASGLLSTKKAHVQPTASVPKKTLTQEGFDSWVLDLSQASSFDDLKSIYSRIIIDVRKNYIDSTDIENKLCIVKDEIKENRFTTKGE
jgi:hypothetical protein